ncbi:MAG: TonB family protein, partial [Candidatus Solibacter sp.]|nr:TonB family protein [Candidatus Solibacter sp.]
MTWLDFVVHFVVRGTVILAAAFAAAYGARRASAAVRHFVWTLAFIAMLLLPAAMRVGPRFAIPSPAPAPAVRTTAIPASTGRPSPTPAPIATPSPLYLYAIGVLLVLGRFAAGAWRMSRIVRTAHPALHAQIAAEQIRADLGIGRRIRVLESSDAAVPMTWGIRRAIVLLPAASREWPAARLNAVLLHELVHVARFDLLAQLAAQAACSLYWFHPLVWTAARQLRKERELACDDAVLRRGITAPDYGGHLMELARVLVERQASLADAPAMAEAGDLEDRVRALLDRTRNRAPLTRRAAAVAMLACAILLPFASVTSYAQQPRGALAGIVTDPSGARVPRSEVAIKNLDARNEEVAVVSEAGEYGFAAIPPGHYAIEVRAAGFKIGKREIEVVAGAGSRADVALEIGSIAETVKVRGTRTTPAPVVPRAAAPQRIPIGGNVQVSKLISQVKPEYPSDVKQQGITGSVVIRAVISKTGDILNATVINTVHPSLAKAA